MESEERKCKETFLNYQECLDLGLNFIEHQTMKGDMETNFCLYSLCDYNKGLKLATTSRVTTTTGTSSNKVENINNSSYNFNANNFYGVFIASILTVYIKDFQAA
uniref:Uncharacterized protein n=1 Tax=Glossina austeni TaxID=7395 RepID=A0A1A9VMS5_GLOAU